MQQQQASSHARHTSPSSMHASLQYRSFATPCTDTSKRHTQQHRPKATVARKDAQAAASRRARRAIPSPCTPRCAARADQATASSPRSHAFHAQGRASTPPPATSASLPQAAGHLAPAAAPARSPLHRCPSGHVQQHRRRVASTPRRESRRPSCPNLH
jgi:hypothetical protein